MAEKTTAPAPHPSREIRPAPPWWAPDGDIASLIEQGKVSIGVDYGSDSKALFEIFWRPHERTMSATAWGLCSHPDLLRQMAPVKMPLSPSLRAALLGAL